MIGSDDEPTPTGRALMKPEPDCHMRDKYLRYRLRLVVRSAGRAIG
jgi:hypothetical protein